MKQIKSVEFWCFFFLLVNVFTVGADFYFRRSAAALGASSARGGGVVTSTALDRIAKLRAPHNPSAKDMS